MSYIGNTLTTQGFSPAIDYFSGTGSQTAFTLSRPVASVAQVQVVVNNVTQNPSTAYTVSGNTITFTGAPSIGTNNIYVSYTSPITQVQGLTQSPSVIGPMYVGINGATPLGGATNPIVGMSGSANNYVQSYIQNLTNGANSSADFTAYPSNGTDASGWVDMGITSLSYSQAAYSVTGPNEAYLFGSSPSSAGTSVTGNLVIATDANGSSNSIQFYTNGFAQAKSAARLTIDGLTGNVGINGAPSAWGSNYKAFEFASGLTGAISSTGAGATYMQVVNGAYYNGTNWIYRYTGVAPARYEQSDSSGGVHRWFTAASGTAGGTISWTQPMTLDASGNLLVATTTVPDGSQNGAFGFDNTNHYCKTSRNTTSVINQFGFYNPNGQVGTITTSGTSTAYNTSSDYRLKENVQPMTGALSTVAQLKPCTYTWKSDGTAGQGFIAHELQAVVPDCVSGEKDAVDADGNPVYQGVDVSFLVATLTAAIQEQQAIITQLQADVAALKTKAGA
jgi:hypothetical protein